MKFLRERKYKNRCLLNNISAPIYLVVCLIVALNIVACSNGPLRKSDEKVVQTAGVDGNSHELLRSIGELARAGTDAICSPRYLEKNLNIKIGNARVSTYRDVQVLTSDVQPISTRTQFAQAQYGSSINKKNNTKKCYLMLYFANSPLCSVEPDYRRQIFGLEELMPSRFYLSLATEERYKFQPLSGDAAEIRLDASWTKCINDGFIISAQGRLQ